MKKDRSITEKNFADNSTEAKRVAGLDTIEINGTTNYSLLKYT